MRRQFAALDDFAREVAADDEFADVAVWVILGMGRETRLEKMVGTRQLCVLQDTAGVDFQKDYNASKAHAHFVFGRDGCLVSTQLPNSNRISAGPQMLLPALRAGN